jgi:hypothetical protein
MLWLLQNIKIFLKKERTRWLQRKLEKKSERWKNKKGLINEQITWLQKNMQQKVQLKDMQ